MSSVSFPAQFGFSGARDADWIFLFPAALCSPEPRPSCCLLVHRSEPSLTEVRTSRLVPYVSVRFILLCLVSGPQLFLQITGCFFQCRLLAILTCPPAQSSTRFFPLLSFSKKDRVLPTHLVRNSIWSLCLVSLDELFFSTYSSNSPSHSRHPVLPIQ